MNLDLSEPRAGVVSMYRAASNATHVAPQGLWIRDLEGTVPTVYFL